MEVAGVIIIFVAVIIVCASLRYADRLVESHNEINRDARARSDKKRGNS